jgi:hypothetical protein
VSPAAIRQSPRVTNNGAGLGQRAGMSPEGQSYETNSRRLPSGSRKYAWRPCLRAPDSAVSVLWIGFHYAQAVAGITGRLGSISNVTREDTAALSREVPLDLAAIQEAWPAFESGFDSLHGRRMMGLIDNRAGTYRLCTERLPRDIENPLGLDETTIPGGRYLRLRLIGDPPGVYGQIAAAFDELFEHADHDPTRPLIEFYRCEGEVDCLVPVNAAVTGA